MKIGILCAGDEELAPFLPLISNCKITEKAMLKFHALPPCLQISFLLYHNSESVEIACFLSRFPTFRIYGTGGLLGVDLG